MFDWNKLDENTVVHCKTGEEMEAFLKECERHRYVWSNDHSSPTSKSYGYGDIVYCANPRTKELTYTSMIDAMHDELEIVEYIGLCKPNLPRICRILGGEDNPLKLEESFKVKGIDKTFFINNYSIYSDSALVMQINTLIDIINHPEKIIRFPQFSEDEKALMRLYSGIGFLWIARDQNNEIVAYPGQPYRGDKGFGPKDNDAYMIIPDQFLTSITWGNSPFDVKRYLESEAKT